MIEKIGAPGGARTPDLQIRSLPGVMRIHTQKHAKHPLSQHITAFASRSRTQPNEVPRNKFGQIFVN